MTRKKTLVLVTHLLSSVAAATFRGAYVARVSGHMVCTQASNGFFQTVLINPTGSGLERTREALRLSFRAACQCCLPPLFPEMKAACLPSLPHGHMVTTVSPKNS